MSSPTPFNIFMEKKKRRSTTDDLATVKAAAWAWYQHGSGSEGKPMREFDATKAHNLHHQSFKPSRYKLEAMENIKECSTQQSSSMPSPIHIEDNNSLLDAYEVERISKELDYFLVSSGNFFDKDLDRQNSINSTISSSSSNIGYNNNNSATKKKNKKFLKGIWTRHTIVCGTRDDVDSRAFVGFKPPPLPVPGRHVPMVRMAMCRRPRAAHA